MQMGGSDQWGNITTGAELIRRAVGGEAHALTCPLLTRADGGKFGKSEGGENVWLDPAMTSPYKFYQYWLNCSDDDAPRLLRMFTLLPREEIARLEAAHAGAPHERYLQKALAREMTGRIHSAEECRAAVDASEVLFGDATTESLRRLPEKEFLAMFEGVPHAEVSKSLLERGIPVVEFAADRTKLFASRGEAKRMIQQGGLFLNREKVAGENYRVTAAHLLNGRYLLLQKGKKTYCVVKAV
jgi:tyrosyl-tRNA synthetase